MTDSIFNNIMIFVIASNSFFLALEGNYFAPEVFIQIEQTNSFFNAVYMLEFVLKIIGIGVIAYFTDYNNYLDFLIVAFSALDFALLAKPNTIGNKF